jgi:hypothetical protein
MPDRRPSQSVARRVALTGSLSLIAVLAVMTGVLSLGALEQRRDVAETIAVDKAQAVSMAIDGFDQSSRVLVDRFFTPFRSGFSEHFELDAAGGTLSSFGEKLNGNFTLVDKF